MVAGNSDGGSQIDQPTNNAGGDADYGVLYDPLRLLHLNHFQEPPEAFCRAA